MLLPSNGATQSGDEFLDASASPSPNVTKVVFVLTGGAVGRRVISGSSPTLYGWIGAWNTATVPDGTYVLQSVASYADGESGTSPGLTIAVYNGTLRSDGSVEEAWLTGAHPGDQITLMQHGRAVANPANPGVAGSLGALIIRDLQPGPGYWWLDATTGQKSSSFAVLAPGDNPAPDSSLYTDQPMHQGLNYITMRDGIELAATVRYPYGETCSAASPCPTVIEYSGYNVAGPTDPIPSLIDGVLGVPCTTCGNPNLLPDSATDVGAVVARFAGFATVSLQMRGTGCSGGAFDLFGYPSDYDAYDAVADRRPPVLGRQPQGRHGRHQLLGPLPVPGGRHRPAGSRGHRADEPDRRPLLDRVPGWHLQQRVRRRLDQLSHRRRQGRRRLSRRHASRRARRPRSPAWGSPGPTTRSTPSSPPTPRARPRPAWPTRRCTTSPRTSPPSSARSRSRRAPAPAGTRRSSTAAP